MLVEQEREWSGPMGRPGWGAGATPLFLFSASRRRIGGRLLLIPALQGAWPSLSARSPLPCPQIGLAPSPPLPVLPLLAACSARSCRGEGGDWNPTTALSRGGSVFCLPSPPPPSTGHNRKAGGADRRGGRALRPLGLPWAAGSNLWKLRETQGNGHRDRCWFWLQGTSYAPPNTHTCKEMRPGQCSCVCVGGALLVGIHLLAGWGCGEEMSGSSFSRERGGRVRSRARRAEDPRPRPVLALRAFLLSSRRGPAPARPPAMMTTEGFDCSSCKESLYGRKYIQADEGPFCIPCYDAHFANTCDECKELIGHDCRELYYEDRHYHAGCFRCFRCDCSLADEPFTCQGEELLCNGCYCREFSSQCVACQQVVMPGSRKLEYNGQAWHEHCFLCSSCQEPIGSRSFIPDQKDYYCIPCYESKFAPRCTRCKKSLTKGGVTYRDEPWHRECFVCMGCGIPLAGQQFTSQEEQPFCLKCFGNLYAKKCNGCTKPITGFGGGKYVSFEDRHWHHNCFSCSRCAASLVGKGFIPEKDQILCRDCAGNSL